MTPPRPVLVLALVAAVVTLVASAALTLQAVSSSRDRWRASSPGYGAMMGPGALGPAMMGDSGTCMPMGVWLPGDAAAVTSTAAARERASLAAQPRGLTAGEVTAFARNYYVVLLDGAGAGATEVLVDPATGAVCVEPGPATMWNTTWGLHPTRAAPSGPTLSTDEARTAAQAWLDSHFEGADADTPLAFPGYYTLDYEMDGRIAGMLSINATDATVWPHTWHGTFISEDEPPD